MPIPILPPPVLPTDTPDDFDSKMFALLAALAPFVDAANLLELNVNAKELSATAAAVAAALAADTALAGSSFKGAWSAQSGAMNKPATVTHGGNFWALLNNLANVASSQPGVTGDWEQMNKIQGNAVGGVNFLKGANVASAATPNVWTPALGNSVTMTGTTTVTGLTAAPIAGAERWVVAGGAFKLQNGANFIVQGGVDYTCAVGDILRFYADTTTQFRVTVFKADGSPAVREGWVPIATASMAGVASAVFNAGINASFDAYVFDFANVYSSSNAQIRMRTSSDGGTTFANSPGDYAVAEIYQSVSSPTPAGYGGASESYINLHAGSVDATAGNGGLSGRVFMYLPASTAAKKHFDVKTMHMSGATEVNQTTGACTRNSTAAINAVQFTASAGNLSGVIRLFGIKKS